VMPQMSAGFDWSASVSSQSLDLEFMSLDTVYEIASRVKALVSEAVCVCGGVCVMMMVCELCRRRVCRRVCVGTRTRKHCVKARLRCWRSIGGTARA
jgi:hypothetical protein